jgi:tripartite-type tricarboxylate transporter receptor subunit TctC
MARDRSTSPRAALRWLLPLLTVLCLAIMACPWRAAAEFPDRPVTMVVPYAAGVSVDTIARRIADAMAQNLGRPIVIDNRPGASTTIASAFVARAAPDGYTMLFGTPALSINPVLQPSLPPGDPRQVLAPIGRVATVPFVMVIGPALPVQDLSGLIAWARTHPGQLTLGSAGAATLHQLGTDLFARMAGMEITTVPYSGTGGASTDIAAGRLHGQFYQTVEALSLVRGSISLKAIGVSALARSPVFPDLPAIAEALPGYEMVSWNGLFAPVRTADAVLERLNAALNAAVQTSTLRRAFEADGMELVGGSRAALATHLDAEIRQWMQLRAAREHD